MRKATLYAVNSTRGTLDKLLQYHYDTKTMYQLLDILEIVDKELEKYGKVLQNTLEKHGAGQELLSNSGQDREKYQAVIKDLEPVLNKVIEFPNITITRKDLENISEADKKNDSLKVSAQEIINMRWLTEEPPKEEEKEENETGREPVDAEFEKIEDDSKFSKEEDKKSSKEENESKTKRRKKKENA